MRVTDITYPDGASPWYVQYHVWFEHNGVTWSKEFQDDMEPNSLKKWLNSVIEDTIARTR